MQDASVGIAPTLVGALLNQAERQPDKPHFILRNDGLEHRRSFAELALESRRFATLYLDAGVREGDVVLLFLRTRPDMLAALYGAMLIRAIPSFMPCPSPKQDPALYWDGHRTLVARIGPRALIADARDAADMRQRGLHGTCTAILDIDDAAAHEPLAEIAVADPGDVALLQHSSGTTGLKKGVMLSHRAIMEQLAAIAAATRTTASDVMASWLPIYHDMGLVGSVLAPLALGQTVVMLDPFEWSSDPGSLFRAISDFRATMCWLPNFALAHLCRATANTSFDVSSLRLVNVCSEPAKADTMARFVAHLGLSPSCVQVCYAMAETVLATTQTSPDRAPRVLEVAAGPLRASNVARPPVSGEATVAVVSCGGPISAVELRVLTETGAPAPDRHVGEIVVSGRCLFDGYYKLPELTSERLHDGWLRTRDLGFIDDGELFVLGRKDDLIIVHGRNIYAHEVEAVASQVAGVKPGRLVAFGAPNQVGGSDDIVLVAEGDRDPLLARSIKEAVFQGTSFVIREAKLVPPGWLIKTTSGKIGRGANRDKYLAERASL